MPETSFPNVTQLAIPFFIAAMLIELAMIRWRNARGSYETRDTLTSLLMGTGNVVAGLLLGVFSFAALMWVWQFRFFDWGLTVWAGIIAFLLDDLRYYWYHRIAHTCRWVWAEHVNHHSSQHYNLSTALRQTWTGMIALGFVFRLPLLLIGFPPAMIVFCAGLNLVYQFWFHTEAIGKCPRWFEAVMNTPSHHRVHHATNPLYLDRNYAGVFIVWDRLFGTFQAEREGEPIHYGIVKQLGSFNLLWTAFHEWIGIARDLWTAPWRHKLSYLWRPPGWTHDGSRDTSDMLRARWEALEERSQS